jgi:hypothetical protein
MITVWWFTGTLFLRLEFPGNYISKCLCNNVPRRCSSHKSKSARSFFGRTYRLLTFKALRRKSHHHVLASPSQLNNIQSLPYLATTSLPRKVRNGKNIEKYQHLLFLMWASFVPNPGISGLTVLTWTCIFSATTSWFGMRVSKSCRACSAICGRIRTLSQWTMLWTSHCL